MGKSNKPNKPNKWFKAVKNAFRSPSKERPSSPDQQDTKADGDETLLSKQYDLSPVRHPQPTPHPLPSFEIVTHDEAEPERSRGQQVLPHPLPTPEAVDPAIVANHSEKAPENVIEEENNASNGVEVQVVDKQQQQQDDDDSISEEEEAAARIQQRFNEPLALNGLIRLQALLRGHQVRRQAATTLTTMESIVRVQAVFRGRRVRVSKDGRAVRSRISKRRRLSSRAGHHVDASRGGLQPLEPQVIQGEREVFQPKRPTANLFTQQLKRSAPNRSSLVIDCNPGQPHWGWAWLELWSYARPWEDRDVEVSKGSSKSKDFIEIIPSRKNSEYTTKEVDVNTLKVKYYEDFVPNPTPAKSRSSNPMSEKKEPVKSSSPMSEKKEPVVKASKEPVRSSSQKEHGKSPSEKESTKSANSMLEKRENAKSSAEKKEPTRLPEKKEPIRSARSFAEKKDFLRSSSSSLSEKRESVRASLTSSLSEKKEPVRSPSSPFSEKRERLRSPSSPLSEKKELARSPSSPLSEKIEPDFGGVADWRAPVSSPATTPTSPPNGHHVIPKPPPIEVPVPPAMEEDISPIQKIFQPGMADARQSPAREKSMPPSPAGSESSLPIPPSPQASDTSLPVPETPPGLDSAGEDPSVTVEHLVLPGAHNSNHRGDTYGALNGETHSSGCGSASNDEHQDAPSAKGSSSDVVNGHTSNGHQENGDSKSPNVEKGGENGDSPIPSKRPACRYMVPTESAKAKFRSSSNPKTRGPDTPDSPVRTTPKRYSIGSSPTVSKGTDSPKTAFGTRKSQSFQNRGTPSPKAATPKEKPRSMETTGAESPARRNSLSGDKRWRT